MISCLLYIYIIRTIAVTIGPNYYIVGNNLQTPVIPYDQLYNITVAEDTTDIIQQALDDIDTVGGGVVHIISGTYYLNKCIQLDDNIHLKGDGINQTLLALIDRAPAFASGSSKKSGLVRAKRKNNITISNMTLDGNRYYQYSTDNHLYGRHGIYLEACQNVWIHYVSAINFQRYGFNPHGHTGDGLYTTNLILEHCSANDNVIDGFSIDSSKNVTIINCGAHNNGRHGISIISESGNVTIKNNNITNNGFHYPPCNSGCAVRIYNSIDDNGGDVIIEDNYIADNERAGVCYKNTDDIEVHNNFINETYLCVDCVNSYDSIINNNTCIAQNFTSLVDCNTTIFW